MAGGGGYMSFAHYLLYYVHFLSPVKFFTTDFSAPMRASLQTLVTPEVYSLQENHDAGIYFAFFFPFFHLSVQYNV